MDKPAIFFSQLLILGGFVCMTTAVSLRHKRNLIAEYQWPEPNPEINQFPHESTCHYYYLALSEDDITVNKCPDGELFDYIDHKCSRKETARCWSRHFGKMKHHHIPLKSSGQFRCPYAWGKYPDIKDCTKYYVCLSGKVKHKKCAPYEHFDKVSRKCVAAIDGVCANQTDVVDPNYKCPRTWGSFSFSKDCSKYYECLEKKPNLRTCPTDTLFHERKEKCLPQNHVHCGSRHNPYSKKEGTSAIDESTRSGNPSVTVKETESDVKIISETKISTIDPNSIIIERMPSLPDAAQTTLLPTQVTQSPNEPATGEHAGELPSQNLTLLMLNETQSDITTGELSSDNAQNWTLLVLNETELTDLPSKQSVSNETESLMNVNTETISVNDTDEITDDDSGNTDEFIEISTSETKSSSSSSVTQAITVNSAQSTKAGIGEIKEQQTTVESPQATPLDECSPKDPTCITQESGRIVRCPTAAGLHSYPGDERRFLVCENSNVRVRYCSGDTIFNLREKKCIGSLIF